jgi:hypothetical protein
MITIRVSVLPHPALRSSRLDLASPAKIFYALSCLLIFSPTYSTGKFFGSPEVTELLALPYSSGGGTFEARLERLS